MAFFAAIPLLGAHGGQALMTLCAGRVMVLDSGLEGEYFQFLYVERERVVMGGGTHSARDTNVVTGLQLSDDITELFSGFVGGAV